MSLKDLPPDLLASITSLLDFLSIVSLQSIGCRQLLWKLFRAGGVSELRLPSSRPLPGDLKTVSCFRGLKKLVLGKLGLKSCLEPQIWQSFPSSLEDIDVSMPNFKSVYFVRHEIYLHLEALKFSTLFPNLRRIRMDIWSWGSIKTKNLEGKTVRLSIGKHARKAFFEQLPASMQELELHTDTPPDFNELNIPPNIAVKLCTTIPFYSPQGSRLLQQHSQKASKSTIDSNSTDYSLFGEQSGPRGVHLSSLQLTGYQVSIWCFDPANGQIYGNCPLLTSLDILGATATTSSLTSEMKFSAPNLLCLRIPLALLLPFSNYGFPLPSSLEILHISLSGMDNLEAQKLEGDILEKLVIPRSVTDLALTGFLGTGKGHLIRVPKIPSSITKLELGSIFVWDVKTPDVWSNASHLKTLKLHLFRPEHLSLLPTTTTHIAISCFPLHNVSFNLQFFPSQAESLLRIDFADVILPQEALNWIPPTLASLHVHAISVREGEIMAPFLHPQSPKNREVWFTNKLACAAFLRHARLAYPHLEDLVYSTLYFYSMKSLPSPVTHLNWDHSWYSFSKPAKWSVSSMTRNCRLQGLLISSSNVLDQLTNLKELSEIPTLTSLSFSCYPTNSSTIWLLQPQFRKNLTELNLNSQSVDIQIVYYLKNLRKLRSNSVTEDIASSAQYTHEWPQKLTQLELWFMPKRMALLDGLPESLKLLRLGWVTAASFKNTNDFLAQLPSGITHLMLPCNRYISTNHLTTLSASVEVFVVLYAWLSPEHFDTIFDASLRQPGNEAKFQALREDPQTIAAIKAYLKPFTPPNLRRFPRIRIPSKYR